MSRNKSKIMLVSMAVLIIIAVGAGGIIWWLNDRQAALHQPLPLVSPDVQAQKKPPQEKQPASQPEAEPAASSPASQTSQSNVAAGTGKDEESLVASPVQPVPAQASASARTVPPVSSSSAQAAAPVVSAPEPAEAGKSGNKLGILTALRAQLAELKIQAEIEEQQARINKAKERVTPPVPELPVLKLPEIVPLVHRDLVVAVQGIDGRMSASIRTRNGVVTVRPGQSFGGGVIESISRDGVVLRQGRSVKTLPFE
jgi:type IV pilus biogenesis protein PilP